MKSLLAILFIAGSAGLGAQTLADDVVSTAGKAQQEKVMAECMKKQAVTGSKMSQQDIKKVCQEQMQAQKDANDKTAGTPPN